MGPVFNDPAIEPTSTLIQEALGEAHAAWEQLGSLLAEAGVVPGWRYYRDGGWLIKAVQGSKTMAWAQVNQGFGRITFYFAQRYQEPLFTASALPTALRQRIKAMPKVGKSLAVTLEIRTPADVAEAGLVLDFKQSLK